MIKRLLWLYTLLILVGCTEDEIVKNATPEPSGEEEFYATFEGTDSRTYLNERILMRWNAEDRITLFKKNTYNRTYMFTGETGDNAGGFKQVSADDEFWHGISMDYNYAVYPHSTKMKLDETDGYLTIDMPAEQTYAENSFGPGANTMVAISEYNQLTFKNVCSSLRIRLYSKKNIDISSITLTANGNQAIAGMAKVTPVLDGVPTCEMTGNQKSIRLNCPTPVTVSTDAEAPTDFWIVIPPVTLNDGFSVTIEDSEGGTQTFNVSNSCTFKRNTYYNFTKEVNTTPGIPYITFTAHEEQTLTMSKTVKTLEFSVNGGNWTELGTTTVTFGGENGKLRLRGKNLSGTGENYNQSATILFGNSVPVACTGDIRTLLDYENHSAVNTENARFCRLFQDCTSLVEAPELPATTLADQCYASMFENCTSLRKAPELPATNLTTSCYTYMFKGCTSLTSAPKLPAKTLAERCYNDMFYNCTSLTKAPELPATKLDKYCYYYMFEKCTSLTSAPKLPATTLAECCYSGMFSGCTSLTTAPELPATTLAEDCYSSMFSRCTSLTSAPKLPATNLASYCYSSMFSGCTSLTKAPELPATNLTKSCYMKMFYGCTNLTSAPELRASTLKSYAYDSMFSGCSKINNITMLATDINAVDCLYCWLYGVPSVGTFTKAKEMESLLPGYSGIPTGWKIKNYGTEEDAPYVTFKANATQTFTLSKAVENLEYSVNGNVWTEVGTKTISFGGIHGDLRLRGKNSRGTNGATISFGKASVPVASSGNILTLVDYDNYNNSMLDTSSAYFARLFQNCTVLTSAPELPTMSLAFECYALMFSGCTSLTKAPALPATTLIWGCYGSMFENCTSLTEAPDLIAPSMAPNCYSHMFYGCTSLAKAPKIAATTTSQWSCAYMFYGCTSLETAPELPATSLGRNCYDRMFYGCTSLKTAPELPATVLSENCYYGMFYNCTSLKTAPVLPAATLTYFCYNYMFYGCTNLNKVTMLATDISEVGLNYWLYNTAPVGTFIKAKEMTSLPSGVHGIPSGWSVKNYGK